MATVTDSEGQFFNTSYERLTKESILEVSIVMPCLNEAETLAAYLKNAPKSLPEHSIVGERLVAGNDFT